MSDRVRVLAVDDSITIRKALELILTPAGYDVAFAASGAEALEQAARQRPDLVLLDFILPDMRGSDVCRALREDAATATLPVVLISARGAEIQQAYQDAANVVRYLAKPFTPDEVLDAVAELTGPEAVGLVPAPTTEAAVVSEADATPAAATLDPAVQAPAATLAAETAPVASLGAAETAADLDAAADALADADLEPAVAVAMAPRQRETLEAMFETLRAGLEGVFVEEVDTRTGAAADQAKSYTDLASRLSQQLGEALRQAESGGRFSLCDDGSVRSLGETLLDSYRRVCRLLFRAAAAGQVERDSGDARPRVLIVSRADSQVADALDGLGDCEDWVTFRVCSDYRQLPIAVRLYGPTHLVVEASASSPAVWDQLRLVRAMPEARRMEMIGIHPGAEDGAAPSGLLDQAGLGDLLDADADLAVTLRERLTPVAAAA